MTTYTVRKGSGGRRGAEELGSWTKKHWYSQDAEAELADGTSLLLRSSAWNKHFFADLTTGQHLGAFDRTGWLKDGGTLRWDGVDYEFATKSGWKSTFALRRLGEELAEFAIKGFTQDVVVTTAEGVRPDPGLLLFCSYISLVTIRQRTAAVS